MEREKLTNKSILTIDLVLSGLVAIGGGGAILTIDLVLSGLVAIGGGGASSSPSSSGVTGPEFSVGWGTGCTQNRTKIIGCIGCHVTMCTLLIRHHNNVKSEMAGILV